MKIVNKKATFDYIITERLEAGVLLTGAEVKSVKSGQGKLEGAFVRLTNFEAYLVNAHIFPYAFARIEGYEPTRTRKLLLHKKEIFNLKSKMDGAHLTLVPMSWYTKGPYVKLEIGIGKGKKQYEKREVKRKEDQRRELERDYRGKIK